MEKSIRHFVKEKNVANKLQVKQAKIHASINKLIKRGDEAETFIF